MSRQEFSEEEANRTQPTDTAAMTGAGKDVLFTEVYARLKALARHKLSGPQPQTLQTTALVHELYLRMGRQGDLSFSDVGGFFAYAAKAMRHLLADRARDRLRQRAGGGWVSVSLDSEDIHLAIDSADEALAMEQALVRLEAIDARAARVVELRYFAGLSLHQTADTLELARSTVDRDWRFARAFLHAELGG